MSYSNKNQREAFSKSIKDDRLSHAYIVNGGDAASRHVFIYDMLRELFCQDKEYAPCGKCLNCRKIENGNMEDLIFLKKDGNSIKVDQIKELVTALSNKPFTSRTVAVIEHADAMTPESQNKLLKSLEEPAAGTVIILSTDNLFSLFPTIRSRCIVINLGDPVINHDQELEEKAANIVKYSMSDKPLNDIFREVKDCTDSGSEAEKLLDALEIFVRDIIVGRYSQDLLFSEENKAIVQRINWNKGYPFEEYLKLIEKAREELRRNINWKYTMKNMILCFKQEELHG